MIVYILKKLTDRGSSHHECYRIILNWSTSLKKPYISHMFIGLLEFLTLLYSNMTITFVSNILLVTFNCRYITHIPYLCFANKLIGIKDIELDEN